MEVPATGGAERSLALTGAEQFGLAWAPDGSSLAIVDKPAMGAPDAIYLMSTRDGSKHQLTSPPADYIGDCFPRFSPDGRRLALVRARYSDSADVYVMDLRGGSITRVTRDEKYVFGPPDWLEGPKPAASIFGAAQTGRTGAPVEGRTGRKSSGTAWGRVRGVVVAGRPPTARLVRIQIDSNVWRLPGPLSPDAPEPARVIESTQVDSNPQYSPDGRKIAFVSSRSGTHELWISDSDGSNAARLTFLETNDIGPAAWSLDGRVLALSAPVTDSADVYLIPAEGGFAKRLTSEVGDEVFPSFSGDGKWIYFSSRRSGSDQVWPAGRGRVDPDDAGRRIDARESPDSRFLYFTTTLYVGRLGVWRQPLAGGPEEKIAHHGRATQWALLDAGPCYVKNPRGDKASVECFETASRSVTWAAPLEGPAHLWGALSVSPDRKWILLDRWDEHENDLMMVRDFK